jgi:hypothetical protein
VLSDLASDGLCVLCNMTDDGAHHDDCPVGRWLACRAEASNE